MKISKYRIMGVEKTFDGWIRHNGGVDLKMGWGWGNPFQRNFGATKYT